ncbi:hypothetical protein BDV59DRAFT_167953 [Aspergillus ambiguus]|uniref:uncharacterized protein n=1 Tax=Aspergillus ambiguus TaxID=176160 RepID=UPI003CCCD12D
MLLSLLSLLPVATAALTHDVRDALKPRNWDLRLLKPGCTANSSNIDLSVYHASGIGARDCTTVDVNGSLVDSVSWKSPSETSRYDLCMFTDSQCGAHAFDDVIRNGWQVCYVYSGWKGYKVVAAGESCVV